MLEEAAGEAEPSPSLAYLIQSLVRSGGRGRAIAPAIDEEIPGLSSIVRL